MLGVIINWVYAVAAVLQMLGVIINCVYASNVVLLMSSNSSVALS